MFLWSANKLQTSSTQTRSCPESATKPLQRYEYAFFSIRQHAKYYFHITGRCDTPRRFRIPWNLCGSEQDVAWQCLWALDSPFCIERFRGDLRVRWFDTKL